MAGAFWSRVGIIALASSVVIGAGLTQVVPMATAPVAAALLSRPTLRQERLVLHRGDATAVQLEIHALNGRVELAPDATNLLEAEVNYAEGEQTPTVMYIERANRGYGNLYQPWSRPNGWSESPNTWRVHLRENIPYALVLNLGNGPANINLNGLSIFRLHVHSQSEQLNLDLSHRRPGGMFFFLTYTGPGLASLHLPSNEPMQIAVLNSLTSINGQPLSAGMVWSNRAYSRLMSTRTLLNVSIAEESGPVAIQVDE